MIQSLQLSQAQPVSKLLEASQSKQATPAELTQSFGQYLQQAIDGVSAQEKNVHTMNDKFLIGEVDVSQVLIASEQAQLSLQLTAQVRNKVIEAYQEIMRMQV
ncbi:flagellar hook-basal body complex protein FliE [Paenibacillus sp. NEAU-GSW1]|uniref:flagellar hook-basal body complex protein FliE n=1 Tax=Paenibacillus sp. NEAU-GSW1 TaxID=2682486 RepID=UPI0012E28EDF|nr:flagellar hook-basal body complex protein FliE [Paenibacillus sp. NEAU-GSW1]MUT66349.1 flagellar hook-basal body complex protein FliE [Paenibacillus sp. NEAU-GSW1]